MKILKIALSIIRSIITLLVVVSMLNVGSQSDHLIIASLVIIYTVVSSSILLNWHTYSQTMIALDYQLKGLESKVDSLVNKSKSIIPPKIPEDLGKNMGIGTWIDIILNSILSLLAVLTILTNLG